MSQTIHFDDVFSIVYQAKMFVHSAEDAASIEWKEAGDIVTTIDKNVSNFIKEELYKLYPDVDFVTEEEKTFSTAKKRFILDPIDGTVNLTHGYKMSAISLAYVEDEEVVFGVVFNPFTREIFFAIRGKGAHYFRSYEGVAKLQKITLEKYHWNTLSVTKNPLKNSLIEFGANAGHKEEANETFERAKRVFVEAQDLRRVSAASLSICYVAAGRLDGYFEKVIRPWDFAAAKLILEEAGGIVTDWQGNKVPLNGQTSILCSNGVNYEDLKNLVVQ